MAAEPVAEQEAPGMRVEEWIDIKRPLGDVFNYVSDVGNYPEWMAHA